MTAGAAWRLRLGALALGLILALATVGCGGDDELARSDGATVKAMLASSAAVQRAFQELYFCVPEERRCYTEHGPNAVVVVAEEQSRFAAVLAETDDACLTEVGRLYQNSLEGYAAAARAARDGDPDAFDLAISRTTEDEISYNRKLTDCGFTEGRIAEIGAAIREINVDLLRLSEEFADCAHRKCLRVLAGRMEERSTAGVTLLNEFMRELSDAPDCLTAAVAEFRAAFVALRAAARAFQSGDLAVAERESTRAGELEVEAQQDMATCLSSLGV
jgi:hypothetical protein